MRPATNDGIDAGSTTWRSVAQRPAPIARPARCRIGGTWSTPLISPLAIDGAAPSTTTNVIAPSDSWNSTMASGNQAIDGIVCRPVISEPTAERAIREDTTIAPMATPMTRASA